MFVPRVYLRVCYPGGRSTLGDGVTGWRWMRSTLGDVTDLGGMRGGLAVLRYGGQPNPKGLCVR